MDERKRMLATAWRDLAGWSVGMVLSDGCVVVGWRRSEEIAGGWYIDVAERDGNVTVVSPNLYGFQHLPDPYAPANWGVWLDSLQEEWAVNVNQTTRLGTHHFVIDVGPGLYESDCRASALLGALCRAVALDSAAPDAPPPALPPSVTAWWEAEQQGGEA